MRNLVLETKRYAIYVQVIVGEGDGTLIYIDARGHIHIVGPGDPPIAEEKLRAAAAHIETGIAAAFHAVGAPVESV